VLKPGSIFGNISFNEGKNTHFAEATEDTYVCIFNVDDFMKIIQAKPQIMMKLLKVMSIRLQEYENRLKSGLYDAKEKILHHLAIIEEKNRKKFLNKLLSKKVYHITHEQLANHTGLTRETVTRAIQDLKKAGVIETNEEGKIVLS